MIEHVHCVVVASDGSLGLSRQGNADAFAMLNAPVEFDETPTEAMYRTARRILGPWVRFENLVELNALYDEDETRVYTFALHVRSGACTASVPRGFQWLSREYRQAAEAIHPRMLGVGVASTYRRALLAPPHKLA